jgi:hypothetical protein
MKRTSTCFILLLMMACISLIGQEVKSKRSSLRISNIPQPEVEAIPDTKPPSIELITPRVPDGAWYTSSQPEIDLIGKATDDSGISFVSVNSELRSLNTSGIFTSRLLLEPGENQIRIIAMDQEDNLKEHSVLIKYVPPVMTLADKINRNATYYGLIIGIDKYRDDEIQDLDNPVKDATQLYQTLISKYNFQEENIELIKNATREEIIRSLDELAKVITKEDNLLIFYAGHGWWEAEASNGYWLPSDAESGVRTNWFRNSALVDYLREIDSKHTLLITDACFGGSIFKTRSAFGSREKAYEKLYELPSRKAMTSGTLTKVPDRSSFTRFLIERLQENNEEYLSSEQLFSSFRLAVINNSDAIPQYGEIEKVGDQGGDFIFLLK